MSLKSVALEKVVGDIKAEIDLAGVAKLIFVWMQPMRSQISREVDAQKLSDLPHDHTLLAYSYPVVRFVLLWMYALWP
jgi:hypothetical protein